ncbi:hypothetical protein PR048_031106 [Dryococelus australis]|uniref:Uncharacterized protein n=1 Tax=Dryococelus australis TaxID=614101 RepID=A0ABQ9G4B4_9NEOP|nr:hypothetical protein PR048_031106 [Dryococelus australis]
MQAGSASYGETKMNPTYKAHCQYKVTPDDCKFSCPRPVEELAAYRLYTSDPGLWKLSPRGPASRKPVGHYRHTDVHLVTQKRPACGQIVFLLHARYRNRAVVQMCQLCGPQVACQQLADMRLTYGRPEAGSQWAITATLMYTWLRRKGQLVGRSYFCCMHVIGTEQWSRCANYVGHKQLRVHYSGWLTDRCVGFSCTCTCTVAQSKNVRGKWTPKELDSVRESAEYTDQGSASPRKEHQQFTTRQCGRLDAVEMVHGGRITPQAPAQVTCTIHEDHVCVFRKRVLNHVNRKRKGALMGLKLGYRGRVDVACHQSRINLEHRVLESFNILLIPVLMSTNGQHNACSLMSASAIQTRDAEISTNYTCPKKKRRKHWELIPSLTFRNFTDNFSNSVGPAVAERLARSSPTKVNRVQSPAGSPDCRKRESCRTMPLGSPVSPAPSFRRHSIFMSITLIGPQDLDVKSRPKHHHSNSVVGYSSTLWQAEVTRNDEGRRSEWGRVLRTPQLHLQEAKLVQFRTTLVMGSFELLPVFPVCPRITDRQFRVKLNPDWLTRVTEALHTKTSNQ